MGCCQSSPSEDGSSPRIQHPPAPRAQDQVRASISSAESRRVSFDDSATRLTGQQRPNKPIRPPSPLRTSPSHISHLQPPWTREQLQSERTAFFDTRVNGQAEVWSALRLVCELLQKNDVVEAQGILDAVNVTCPNGRVAIGRGRDRARGGVYDERGELYEIPTWLLTDPRDIVELEEKDSDVPTVDDERREEKGKGRAADIGEIIQLRARLSDRGVDIVVSVGKKELVAAIIRKIQEQVGQKRLRLVYLGHVLQETKDLDSQNYRNGDVVNAYVFEGSEDLLRKQRMK